MWRRSKRFCVTALALASIVAGSGCDDWIKAAGGPLDAPGLAGELSKSGPLSKVRFSLLPQPTPKSETLPGTDDGSARSAFDTTAAR